MRTAAETPVPTEAPVRVAVAAADVGTRQSLVDTLRAAPGIHVVAWADSTRPLLVLGTRADVCLCTTAPADCDAEQLAGRGCVVVVPDGDPVTAVLIAAARGSATPRPTLRRPHLSPRQRDVMAAYVASSDLLPTVARRLGMDPETVKTHLRRIRTKYAEVGRPAPTRRDLYVRAVEDGLLPPPSGAA